MSRCLVTGAAGFVGFHVARRLLDRGDQVVGLDNFNPYYDVRLKHDRLARLTTSSAFQLTNIDLADRQAMEAVFGGERFDVVYHLGAQAGVRHSLENPHVYVDSNLNGTLHILEGCRQTQVGHLVFASSSSVYGANQRQPFCETDGCDHPVSLYAATKRSGELMGHSYSHLYGLPFSGLRFFTVYGPWGRPDMALFKFTAAILAGQPIQVFGQGKLRRDFTYVDDVVEAVVRVGDRPPQADLAWNALEPNPASSNAPYRLYNIGAQRPVELMHFIDELQRALGVSAKLEMLPQQPGDVVSTFADTSALQLAIGFVPETPISEGIAKFVAWYRQYYEV